MLEIQIVSDLHIEYKNNDVPDPLKFITPSTPILALLGDIGSLYKFNQLRSFLEQICKHFEYVLYVPGNHEYYNNQSYECEGKTFNELTKIMFSLETLIPNLYILDKNAVIFNDICVIGCTLWSHAKITIPKFIVQIHDINTNVYNKRHDDDVKYINDMISYCNDNNLKLVVLTHYPPTYDVFTKNNDNFFKKRDRFISLYASDLNHLLTKNKIHTWVSGHIHQNYDFLSNDGTRIVGNQYGKPKDRITDFSKNFVVKI